jgi:hypothetical protein
MDFNNHNGIPEIRLQPVSVDFIENELDSFHPGFANPPSHYDARFTDFVLNNSASEMSEQTLATYNRMQWALTSTQVEPVMFPAVQPPLTLAPMTREVLPVRRRAEPIAALKFWDELFKPSMAQFVKAHGTEPAEVKKKCSIRDQNDWTGVFDRLEAAKNAYSKVDKGFQSVFRKVYRKIADNTGAPLSVVKTTKEFVDNDYASPVLGALQLVLEVSNPQ